MASSYCHCQKETRCLDNHQMGNRPPSYCSPVNNSHPGIPADSHIDCVVDTHDRDLFHTHHTSFANNYPGTLAFAQMYVAQDS